MSRAQFHAAAKRALHVDLSAKGARPGVVKRLEGSGETHQFTEPCASMYLKTKDTLCKRILRCRFDRARTDYKNKSACLQNSLARAMAKITSARPWKTVSGSARSLEPTACKTHRAPVIYDRMVGSWKSEKLSNLHNQILNVFFRFLCCQCLCRQH